MGNRSRRQPPEARAHHARAPQQALPEGPHVQLVQIVDSGVGFTANDFMRLTGGIFQALLAGSTSLGGARAEVTSGLLEEALELADRCFKRSRSEYARHVAEDRQAVAEMQERMKAGDLLVPDNRLVDAAGNPLPTTNVRRLPVRPSMDEQLASQEPRSPGEPEDGAAREDQSS